MFEKLSDYLKYRREYYKRKKAYKQLKVEEYACQSLFKIGKWKLTDEYAVSSYNKVLEKLKEYSNEKYYKKRLLFKL